MKKYSQHRIISALLSALLIFTSAFVSVDITSTASITSAATDDSFASGGKDLTVGHIDIESEDEIVSSLDAENSVTITKESAKYHNKYDVYSTNFFYNQLSSKERKLWNALDKVCRKLLTGTSSLSRNLIGFVEYDSSLSLADAVDVAYMFVLSNPQYYFLNNGFYWDSYNSSNYMTMSVYSDFNSGSARKKATKKLFKKAKAWIKAASKLKTDEAKVLYFHDKIANKVDYEEDDYGTETYNQSAYSVFCGTETVCAGYSMAFCLLCNGAGIDCINVTSDEHQWNRVCLSDNWFNVDVTADDTYVSGQIVYTYYLKSDAAYKKLAGKDVHTAEEMWDGMLMKCKLNTSSKNLTVGSVPSVESRTSVPVITYKKVSGGYKVTIKGKTKGSWIYYTLSGSTPETAYSKCYRYTGSFTVSSRATLKKLRVIAVAPKKLVSKTSSPCAPQNLSVSSASSGVHLSWTKAVCNSRAEYFEIQRKKSGGSWETVRAYSPKSSSSWTDTDVVSGKTYKYRICAFNGKGAKIATTKNVKITYTD
ncbi:MAG: fibronectin type III domain-containing protein [Eubacterium sp.]|nr:fibronectin type III domain-containing protein [Eubacterium sp.]